MRLLMLRRARRAVLDAAKCLDAGVSSDVTGLSFEYDPDELADLRQAVARLRAVEEWRAGM